jgi:hypothetical protein
MTPIGRRLMVILLGYFAASLAAGAILIGPQLQGWGKMVGGFDSGLIGLIIFGFLQISGVLLLPTLAVVAVTEAFNIRRALVYAILGALGLLLPTCLVRLIEFAPVMQLRDCAVMTGAGMVAGVIYWSIAGRNAGGWRKPPPPGPTAESTLSP